MIKDLIKLANHLDAKGHRKEAGYLDAIIGKIARDVPSPPPPPPLPQMSGETRFSNPTTKKWADQVRATAKLADKVTKQFLSMGIKEEGLEANLKENGGRYNSEEELMAAVSSTDYQQLVTNMNSLFATTGLFEAALTNMTHEEATAFIAEIKAKHPDFQFHFNINGRQYGQRPESDGKTDPHHGHDHGHHHGHDH
tara:strand:+ start:14540 stop:15127 length:588 start_codon:yes stop_codon:yes gene_type:complete